MADLVHEARDFVRRETLAVGEVVDGLDASFERVVRLLLDCHGKVIVSGSGTSGWIAGRMAHLLAVTGTPALPLPAINALHGSLGAVTADDVVLTISKGGETEEIIEFARRASRRGAQVVALTARPKSRLALAADVVVTITTSPGIDPGEAIAMGSTLAMASWGDALALILMRVRGHTFEDVLFLHPSGYVGTFDKAPENLPTLSLDEDH